MPRIDFSKISTNGELLPTGEYKCRIAAVKSDLTTPNGDEKWALELHVIEGEHEYEVIRDSLVFGGRLLRRVKLLLDALGIEGRSGIEPEDLEGKFVGVRITGDRTYTDKTGREHKVANVPWDAYFRIDPPADPASHDGRRDRLEF